jgi:CzcA family heavy metal efflux pump
MMRWVIGSSLRLRFLVIAVAVGMMAYGSTRVGNMPLDAFPEFAPPFIEIQTEGPGMSTEEVESLVTIPLEQSLNSTPNLDVMRSKSVPGLSAITLIFKAGTDSLTARQLVNERLAIATRTLPSSSGVPWILQPLSATSRVLKIGISSSRYSLVDLSMWAYWTLRWRLMAVPGVANVVIWGDRWKELQLQVDPHLLRRYDVSLDQVMRVESDALDFGLLRYTTAAKTRVGGFIETPNQRLQVQHVLPSSGPLALARIVVGRHTKPDGAPLRLGDLGVVRWDHQPLIGDAVVNSRQGVLLVVEKFPWANTLDVTRGIERTLDQMRPGLAGVHVDSTIFRPATFIETSLDNLTRALMIGTLLVILVIGAFLFEWRAALISIVAIPLSLMAAALVFYWRGETINTMILAGFVISVGVVVDDAIIDIENIVRRLREARRAGSTRSTAAIVLDASIEVRSAIVYATVIIVLAVLPVFFIGGVTGAFFEPLVLSYGLAVLASMVVAMTVTPALSLLLLANAPLERRDVPPLTAWLQRGYTRLLARVIRSPLVPLALAGAVAVAGVAVAPLLGEELFPHFKERDFLMHWITKPGTSHREVVRMTEQGSRELRAIPGVQNFGSHIGRAVQGEEISGMNFAENWVSVSPDVDYDATVARLEETVEGYPGLFRNVETYLNERIEEVLAGASNQVVVRVFGPDLHVLRRKAEEVEHALSTIPGIADLHVELQTDIPHISVTPDLEKAAVYGLKPGDIRRSAAALVSGDEVSDIHRDNKVYNVAVWSTPETRGSVHAIRDLLIDAPATGGQVRLGEVADVRVAPTPNQVARENNSRRIDIGLNADGRDLGAVVHDVGERLERVRFPLEYHAELMGEFTERQGAQARLLGWSVAAALGIFLLLLTCIGGWRMAVIAFVALPFALVGGVLAAYGSGGVVSMGSLVGFLTVFGIAARNGILLINHFQHLERVEGEPFGAALVIRGARERLAPIVMTALATALALVPLVISGEIPGAEIEYPMAIVILGGLLTSTLLNLFLVPAAYLRFARRG